MAGPSHVDLSVLWVPIMPETSKLGQEMEQVGKDATESFAKGSSGLGDKIHESVSKSRDKIKDVFHRTGSDASDAMADGVKETSKKVEDAVEESGKKARGRFGEVAKGFGKQLVDAVGPDTKKLLGDRLEETVGGALEGVLGDNAKWAGKFSHTVADWGFDELKKKLGDTKEAANQTKAAFADFSSGNTQGGVSKLVDSFGKLGLEAKDLPQPLQDALGKLNEAKSTAQGFADIFKDLPGKIGAVGTALEKMVIPLSAGLMSMQSMDENLRNSGAGFITDSKIKGDAYSQKLADLGNKIPGVHMNAPGLKPSGVDMSDVTGIGKGGDVLGSGSDAYDFFSSGAALPSAAVTPRDVGSDKGLTPTSQNVKKVVSSLFPQINDIGGWRPPDGYNEHSSGQALDVMIPNSNTPQGKALGDQIRDYVMKNAKSLGVDYALWQQTQWNPDGSHSGMENRGSPTQNHMDHVHIHTVRGGGTGDSKDLLTQGLPRGSSSGVVPMGSQHDPLFVTSVDTNGKPTAGSDGQNAAQQLGSGLLDGLAQSVGLDGSVFKGFGGASNPKDFGITKLGMGLLNWGLGQTHGQQVSRSAVPVGPGGSQSVRSGDTYNDNSFTVNQHGVQGESVQSWQHAANAAQNRTPAMTAPNAGGGPSQ